MLADLASITQAPWGGSTFLALERANIQKPAKVGI